MRSTAPPAPPDTLDVRHLTVAYGRSVHALHGVSLHVPPGRIVALLGANGAGKSTLLRAVSGTLPLHNGAVEGGSIAFGPTVLTGRDPAAAVAAGVVQVPEGRRVFAALTVEENLRAGQLGTARRSRAEARATAERVYGLFPVLAERRHQAAGLLSGGEQQMLAMGRALMARPRLLLLDEPSLGLAPQVVRRIAETVREVHRQGTGVLVVEQNAALALELADHACVLENGRVRLEGPAGELSRTDEVRRLYLGEEPGSENGPAAAEVRELARWAG
ncbi:ABC transporter ATP-binding protein [Kitasatospora phosalacinea]|uniref:ABC transporter ATP-binding protein n=1 Tax=Kitasatospora phosalacinea TaxID=2065 RepID=A0ABW6GVY7_9ACTN